MHKPQNNSTVTVLVNNREVLLSDHKTTGLGIKEAAVAHGVAINVNFALFRVAGQTQHPVGDGDTVTVHDKQEFRAVAPDDNS